ncbi:MAG: metal ABC transporter permease [Deltaproteobacteria bacterium]|nr:metal ABC transporter permease [Deltaproteobacteria bacterium]
MCAFLIDLQQHLFLQYALLTGALASVACGVIGAFVLVKRITYIAGGIAHSVLGGMGLALFLQKNGHWEAVTPLHGAVAAAILSALIIGVVSLRAKQREDTVIGALWAVGMAVGVLFISRTPGYNTDLMSYLFGNILMVSTRELWFLVGLDVVVVAAGLAFYNQFVAVCFDGEFAALRGLKVDFFYLLLLCLTALTTVVLAMVVGLVMVIALLTLPTAIAEFFSKTLARMMVLSCVLCFGFTSAGLAVSYGPDLPVGATTILIAGAAYLTMIVVKRLALPGSIGP